MRCSVVSILWYSIGAASNMTAIRSSSSICFVLVLYLYSMELICSKRVAGSSLFFFFIRTALNLCLNSTLVIVSWGWYFLKRADTTKCANPLGQSWVLALNTRPIVASLLKAIVKFAIAAAFRFFAAIWFLPLDVVRSGSSDSWSGMSASPPIVRALKTCLRLHMP